jgi:hypothetical protein
VSWEALWKLVFFGSFAAFAAISVLIAVLGLAEIRAGLSGAEERGPRAEK